MNSTKQTPQMQWRRAELIAELFLQDLEPVYLARPTTDFGYDFFMGFQNEKGGINTYGVEVKATQQVVKRHFQLRTSVLKRLAFSNVPTMLLVVNVKDNQLFYTWLTPEDAIDTEEKQTISIAVQAIDDTVKQQLRAQLSALEAA